MCTQGLLRRTLRVQFTLEGLPAGTPRTADLKDKSNSSVRLKVEQNQLVSDGWRGGFGGIWLQGA